MRIGFGYDVHAFCEGRDLILNGIKIDYEIGLDGHSDADVSIHALCDALLGAACLGDIGKLFPDTDDAFLGIDSTILLSKVMEKIRENGYEIGNIDITIIAQKPKLSGYIDKMRQRLSEVVSTDVSNISVKATTEEHLGFTGRLEGIKATAVVLLNNR